MAPLDLLSRQGTVGVSLFFVLSGFVMAWSHRADDTARAFYRRRFARIVPAYVVALLLFIPVDAYVGRLTPASLGRGLFNLTLLQAWVPSPGWFSGGNPVGWSLSTETFFYAVFPFLIIFIIRLPVRQRMILTLLVVIAAITVPLAVSPDPESIRTQTGWGYWAIYISPITRCLEFVLGVSVGLSIRDGMRTRIPLWAALLIAAVAYVTAGQVPPYASYVAVCVVPFALLIAVAAETDLRGGWSPLRHPVIVKLGEWSYAFYLVHALVIRALGQFLAGHPVSLVPRAGLTLITIVASWAAAGLLYQYVERPFERRLRSKAPASRRLEMAPEGVHE